MREADKLGASVLLGDRDARETLARLRDALAEVLSTPGALDNLAPPPQELVDAMGATNDKSAELSRENVLSTMAALKQRENVRLLSSYLQENVPPFYRALISERDRYMAKSLLGCPGERIVAVVGLAHVDGIEKILTAEASTARVAARPSACQLY